MCPLLFSSVVPACGSVLRRRSCSSADEHPETMNMPEPTPHRNSPSPLASPLGRGKRGRGEKVSLVAQTAGSAVCGLSTVAGTSRGPRTRRSALHQNRGNKARMYMKTKDRRRHQPPLTPPYPRRGIPGLPSSAEEGLGVVRLCDLCVLCALA